MDARSPHDNRTQRTPLLSVHNVSKTFPGQQALRNVSLALTSGEVHCLLGQNGSGKSTLIKILSGYHNPDPDAEFVFDGAEFDPSSGHDRVRGRLHFVHQDRGLVETLNSVDNLALGRGYPVSRLGRVRWRAATKRARRLFDDFGVEADVRIPVSEMTPAERTALAVIRAVDGWDDDAGVLVLDEPTTSLPAAEVERLFLTVRAVTDRGGAVLLVTHRIDDVFEIGDVVSVLRDGLKVATRPAGSLTRGELIRLIVGKGIDEYREAARRAPSSEAPMLQVHGLGAGRLTNLSFEVKRGEILGFAGIVGSGLESVADALFGAIPRRWGSIVVDGASAPRLCPADAIALGVAMVPSERARRGIIQEWSVRENVTLPGIGAFRRRGRIDRRTERAEVARWMDRTDLRPRRMDVPIAQFSGGNQQKAVLAKWMRLEPKVLILDEPTQGVDVGAKVAIYNQVANAARDGAVVVVCSTDAEELSTICDRVVVLHAGVGTAELSGESLVGARITAEILGKTTTRGSSQRLDHGGTDGAPVRSD